MDAPSASMVEHVAVYGIPPVRYERDGRSVVVYFDNCTGRSGKRRALCPCDVPYHAHGGARCEKHVFVENHDNEPKKAAAFLIAWRHVGDICSSKEEEHLSYEPDPAAVEDILASL